MSTLVAIRQARYRSRQRAPARCVYRIEVERDRLLAALVASGWLAAANAQHRDQIEMALSRMLEAWLEQAAADGVVLD